MYRVLCIVGMLITGITLGALLLVSRMILLVTQPGPASDRKSDRPQEPPPDPPQVN